MKYKYDFMVIKDKLDEKEIEELNDCIAKYRLHIGCILS